MFVTLFDSDSAAGYLLPTIIFEDHGNVRIHCDTRAGHVALFPRHNPGVKKKMCLEDFVRVNLRILEFVSGCSSQPLLHLHLLRFNMGTSASSSSHLPFILGYMCSQVLDLFQRCLALLGEDCL